MLGAAWNEIALAAFLVAIVMLAPKIGRIGEAIGRLLGGNASAQDADEDSVRDEPAAGEPRHD